MRSAAPNPGAQGFEHTRELAKVAKITDIRLRDHLVLGLPDSNDGRGYVSIRERRPDVFL